jgi:hypothetical protein
VVAAAGVLSSPARLNVQRREPYPPGTVPADNRNMAKPRVIEPLALIAAILAAGTAVIYVRSMRDQGSQPYAWVMGILLGGGLLAGYGALWRLPYRRAVLVVSGGALIVLGVLALPSIGLLILASAILALISAWRTAPHV